MKMNFGPINMAGGEKRLNVAFSRAKKFMALVSSIRSSAITNDYNDGAKCLKDYLRYAECSSIGQTAVVASLLHGLSGRDDAGHLKVAQAEILADEIARCIAEFGFRVDRRIGQSSFHVDKAICRPDDNEYRLGILIDGEQWYSQLDILERELMKPRLLEAFGWRILNVFASDWYHDSESVVARILKLANNESYNSPPLLKKSSAVGRRPTSIRLRFLRRRVSNFDTLPCGHEWVSLGHIPRRACRGI